MTVGEPYLGSANRNPYTVGERLYRLCWYGVQATLFRWSPRPLHGLRARLLRLFGANIEQPATVKVFPTARIVFPSHLHMAPHSMIGPGVNVYNLGQVSLGRGAKVSQGCHLCSGTHDYTRWSLPLVTRPIAIGANAWLGAEVFVGPGASVGELCVVGARSVVVGSLPARTVCGGNPCRVIKERPMPSE